MAVGGRQAAGHAAGWLPGKRAAPGYGPLVAPGYGPPA